MEDGQLTYEEALQAMSLICADGGVWADEGLFLARKSAIKEATGWDEDEFDCRFEAYKRVLANPDLERHAWILLTDWARVPGFGNFDFRAYYTWLATANAWDVMAFAAGFERVKEDHERTKEER